MAQDYDAPRIHADDEPDDTAGRLVAPRGGTATAVLELDEVDTAEGFELPGADLSGEQLIVEVIPVQIDEFTCYSCFLVRHRSQLARKKAEASYCLDCEG
jgi:hypothetical protein